MRSTPRAEDDPAELMRVGVRTRIGRMTRLAAGGARRWTPPVLLAVLCAGAFGPLLAVPAGITGTLAVAGLGLAGSVGGNVLTDVLTAAIARLRKDGPASARRQIEDEAQRQIDGELQRQIEDELQRQIEELLRAGGEQAARLRGDIAEVLRRIGAIGAAVQEVVAAGDEEAQDELARGLAGLAVEFGEFASLVSEVRAATAEIQDTLRRQDAEHRHERDHRRQFGTRLRLMDEKLAIIEYRTRRPSDDEPAPRGGDARWRHESPYPGLAPFEEDRAELFYGRERATAELVGLLAEQAGAAGMVVVAGVSGAGKSSLLRAGLLPALARGSLSPDAATWPRLMMTPTRRPLEELATHLALLAGLDPATTFDSLARRPDQAHLLVRQAVLAATTTRGAIPATTQGATQGAAVQASLVLVVDQFEEVFTLGEDHDSEEPGAEEPGGQAPNREKPGAEEPGGQAPNRGEPDAEAWRSAFIAALHAAATTPCGPLGQPAALVVLAVRGDFWDRFTAFPKLAGVLPDGLFMVGPMAEPDLRRAITGPADAAGLQIEAGLVDAVLSDLRSASPSGGFEPGALPWLSQAMLITWKHRENGRLTARGYGQAGGVRRAIQTSAETSFTGLSAARQAIAREVLEALVVVAPDGALVRRRRSNAELRAGRTAGERTDLEAVLAAFAAQRLLVVGDDTVEIAHDELLRSWPRLREWLRPDLAGHILYGQLLQDAGAWEEHHRDPSFLYRGAKMIAIDQVMPRWEANPGRYPLTGPPRRFLGASAQAARRTARRRRSVIAALATLLAVSVVAAVTATRFATDAGRERALAVSRRLGTESQSVSRSDPVTMALLAVAGWRVHESQAARNAMLAVLRDPLRGTLVHPDRALAVAYQPGGHLLATAGSDQRIRLWDPVSRRLVGAPLTGHIGPVHDVAFSPDGTVLASTGADKTVRLWDVAARRQVGAPLIGHADFTMAVVFSPDGRTLATSSADKTVRLWDVATRRQLGAPLTGHTAGVIAVAFSPDGGTLATSGIDQTIRLWDAESHRQTGKPITGHKGPVRALAFSPDGKTLASTGADKTVRLWDVASHRPLGGPMTGHIDAVNAVAFTSDGRALATGSSDGSVRLWDALTRSPLGPPLSAHTGSVLSLAFSPDGSTLATASVDNTVRLWNVDPNGPLGTPLTGHTAGVIAVAFSPDGRRLVTGGLDRTVRLWDTTTRAQLGPPLTAHKGAVLAASFSPDGTIFATGSNDRTIRLWDSATGRSLGPPLTGHTNSINALAFAPDGKTLASAGADKTVRLWDVASRRQLGAPLSGHTASVFKVVYRGDGKLMATTSVDRTVRLWDPVTRSQVGAPLTGHTDSVITGAFSPDGRTFASAGVDQTIRLWDVATHRQLGAPLSGHNGGIVGLAYTPDGRTLASGGYDQVIRLWDVDSRSQLGAPLVGHTGTVLGLAVSPDGKSLATAGNDRIVRLWNMTQPQDLVAAVCAVAGRSLTRAEWERYAPEEEFRPVC